MVIQNIGNVFAIHSKGQPNIFSRSNKMLKEVFRLNFQTVQDHKPGKEEEKDCQFHAFTLLPFQRGFPLTIIRMNPSFRHSPIPGEVTCPSPNRMMPRLLCTRATAPSLKSFGVK